MKNIFPLILIFFLCSCETVINVDLPEHESKLVMNSFINPDSLVSVHISNSLSILDNGKLNNAENAVVELYENDNLVETLQHSSDGNYTSAGKYPAIGNTYKITASANGYEDVSASTTVPPAISISSFNLKDSVLAGPHGNVEASLDITINDPANKNYYMLEVFEIDTLTFDTTFYHPGNGINYYYIFSDDHAIGEEQNGTALLFTDEFFNGKSYRLTVKFDSYFLNTNPGYPVYLKLTSLNEDLYLYKKTFATHLQNKGNPFAEPVQVYNNIKNGFGIFGGFSSYTLQVR